jgi:hypothetical protein
MEMIRSGDSTLINLNLANGQVCASPARRYPMAGACFRAALVSVFC